MLAHVQWVVSLFVLLLLTPSLLHAAPASYTVVELGNVVSIAAIDRDGGRVVGTVGPSQRAAILYPTLALLDLLPGGGFNRALGTTQGITVGVSATGLNGVQTHAFRHTDAGGVVDLGTLGAADLFSAAVAVNMNDRIVGYCDNATRAQIVACQWDSGSISALPSRGGRSAAYAVNSGGEVVGQDSEDAGLGTPVRWPTSGGVERLDPLQRMGAAQAINDAGVIVGYVQVGRPPTAFVWTPGGGLVELPGLGTLGSVAQGVSADGAVVVGYSRIPEEFGRRGPEGRAVRWVNGVVEDLNVFAPSGLVLSRALGISATDVILAECYAGTERRGCLLVPQP